LIPRFFNAAMVKSSEKMAVIAAGNDLGRRALILAWRCEAQALRSFESISYPREILGFTSEVQGCGVECQCREICGCLAARPYHSVP
jgi:hypothetical protein